MGIVLVDSKYFGQYLARARKTVNLRRADAIMTQLTAAQKQIVPLRQGFVGH